MDVHVYRYYEVDSIVLGVYNLYYLVAFSNIKKEHFEQLSSPIHVPYMDLFGTV